MTKTKEIIIIGAGPSGLSIAIFLNDRGYRPRIIEKKSHISEYSKALGVNPRTLEIFKPFGISDRFIANGRKMKSINLWKADKHIYKNDLSKAKCQYPFMLVQPQKDSEAILLDEVRRRGLEVEFESEFVNWQQVDEKFEVNLNRNDTISNIDYIIGADGGGSKVREKIGVNYKGFKYDGQWELYDVELDLSIDQEEGHIRLFPDGGMIMIRLKENIWRVAGNLKSILNYLPKFSKVGKVHWHSEFGIHHQVANTLTKDNVVLIGDAAHLHSPVGARGMNLGIEDAFMVSRLLHEHRLNEYNGLRKPYLDKTVKRINSMTMGLAGKSILSRILRSQIDNLSFVFPLIMPRARKFVLGLD